MRDVDWKLVNAYSAKEDRNPRKSRFWEIPVVFLHAVLCVVLRHLSFVHRTFSRIKKSSTAFDTNHIIRSGGEL